MLKLFAFSSFALAAAVVVGAAPLALSEKQVEKKGSAKVQLLSAETGSISIRFDDPGWDSGVRLLPPPGQEFWDLSSGKLLSVDVENLSPDKQLRLTMHAISGSKEEKNYRDSNTGIALNPGEKRTMNLLILHPSVYGAPKSIPGPRVLQSDKVKFIEFYMQWPFEGTQKDLLNARISNLRLVDKPDAPHTVDADRYFPFVDKYGQFIHSDWPQKIHNDDDLKKAHAKELAELAKTKQPSEWNEFGGWAKGPQLKATGSFRTEKYQGKWWLVDPSGRLFFSHGIAVLYPHTDATLSKDHNHWFDFKVETYNLPFTDWNLVKKYGKKDYEPDFYNVLVKRLGAWGMNTIGNWAKSDFIMMGKLPYALQLTDYNSNLPKIGGSKLKFYDVFDPAYVAGLKNIIPDSVARRPELAKSLKDPLCIGYFIDNELNFGNRGRQILGDEIMRSPATQASKIEFSKDLKAKYTTIQKLNTAWETSYADWDAFLAATEAPKSKGFQADSDVFFTKTVEQYFKVCRDAVKLHAPNRLYLGTRFISTDAVRKVLYEASAKYCDVLTVNVYAHNVSNMGIGRFPDMPVMIGEFHFGVVDRGMFLPSLAPTGATQEERATAYIRFMQGALTHPNIVGTHWFQFRDQPLTGRWDGEGYQLGFVDVADTPYSELAAASREVGENMYAYRLRGKLVNEMR